MNCQQCREYLSAYLDGALAESQRQALESHCAGCARCAAERDDLQKILKALPQLPQPPVPENFRRRVWAQIDAQEFASKRKEWRLDSWLIKLPVGALAMAAVVLLVARVSQDTLPQLTAPAALSDVAIQAKLVSLPPAPTQDKDKMGKSQSALEETSAAGLSSPPYSHKNENVLNQMEPRPQERMAMPAAVPAAASPQLTPPQDRASMGALEAEDRQLVSGRKMSARNSSAAGLVADQLEEKQTRSDLYSDGRVRSTGWDLFVEDPSATRVLVLRILEEFKAFNVDSTQPDIIQFQIAASQKDSLERYLGELGALWRFSEQDASTDSTTTIRLTIHQPIS